MSQRMSRGDLGILLVIVCLWAACGEGPSPYGEEPITPVEPGARSAYTDIKPLVDRECVRCHGGRIAPDLRAEAGFNSPKVKNQISSGDMPNDKTLAPQDKAKLLAYFGR